MDLSKNKIWIISCLASLSACTSMEMEPYRSDGYVAPAYGNVRGPVYIHPSDYMYQFNKRYYGEYYAPSAYTGYRENYDYDYDRAQPSVPDSYYTGNSRNPLSFRDTDKAWVSSQNSRGYTIQIAEDEKPAHVAGKLVKVPKNDRGAQIRYQQNGKHYYKGFYGTFESQEAAKKALDSLPQDIKQGATIQGWENVKHNME